MLPSEIPLFPLPNVVLFPSRAAAAAHLRASIPRDGGRRARGRAADRHGHAAAGLGAAATKRRRRSIPSAAPASSRTPIGCPTAATTSCCAASRSSGFSTSGPRARDCERYRVARVESIKEAQAGSDRGQPDARRRLEKLIASKLQRSDRRLHSQRRPRRRPRARHRAASRAARKTGAARVQQPARTLRGARRAARDAHDADTRGKSRALTRSPRRATVHSCDR